MILKLTKDELNSILKAKLDQKVRVRIKKLDDDLITVNIQKGLSFDVNLTRFKIEEDWITAEFKQPLLNQLFALIPAATIKEKIRISDGRFGIRIPDKVFQYAEIRALNITHREFIIELKIQSQNI